jgi:hypothetical protein
MRSLPLRPGDSLTALKAALSMGFRLLVSREPAIQATGLLVVTLVGLTPTENASLRWTHGDRFKLGIAMSETKCSPFKSFAGSQAIFLSLNHHMSCSILIIVYSRLLLHLITVRNYWIYI